MIFDCFTFFDELDLLEIRLHELSGVVDVFVLTESPMTFTGLSKPLYYDENKDRFKEFNIIHDIYYDSRKLKPMGREKAQKQHGLDLVFNIFRKGDVIIQGDVDEIPKAKILKEILNYNWKSQMLAMTLFYYYMNCKGTMAKKWYKNSRVLRPDGWFEYNAKQNSENDITYHDAGWHFSFLGDIKSKLEAWGHAPQYDKEPYNTDEHIEKCKDLGLDLFMRKGNRKIEFEFLEDLTYLPQYVQEHLDRFGKYIWP